MSKQRFICVRDRLRWSACALVIGLCSGLAGGDVDPAKLPRPAGRAVNFAKDVKPIFEASCGKCHGAKQQKSDFRLDRRESALKGGSIGGAIVPGDSGKSKLIHYVAGLDEELKMPPKGTELSAEQIGILRAWIDQGAQWPNESEGEAEKHWSLKPLVKPSLPQSGSVNPIDAFVRAKLEEKGLEPSAQADKRTLIRRVTLNLAGLPPTPREVEEFLADSSSDAYERLVDRLLASPRYGERWARHWMDVAHYAETHGHDEDKPRPNAWPYRDYLISSLNADKPYARFIEEQVAGDVLFPDDPQALVATAFVAVGPWDQSSMVGIIESEDKKVARYLDRDDMIATTMSTFVSSTVHCARCHDHKFDPISQEDYYALQAVFAGVDRIDRGYDADPKVHAARKRLNSEKQALLAGGMRERLLSAEVRELVAAWEKSAETPAVWELLEPKEFKSAEGATLTKLADGSILSGGKRPEKDTVTIVGDVEAGTITGIRLEVLTDDSLPHKGPGRQDNGNLHLSEVTVKAGEIAIPIRTAAADFDQEGWSVARAIDAKSETAWGIYPQVGRAHEAVFEFAQPVNGDGGVKLTVTLAQLHGAGHLIGRARLSITESPRPASVLGMPAKIAAILAVPAEKRDAEEKTALARHVLLLEVEDALAKLPAQQQVFSIGSDFEPRGNFQPAGKPRRVEVLRRGDIRQPKGEARPGALACVHGLPARFELKSKDDEGARRAALARWIAHRDNVLTWRSVANRVWHYHFGNGIVETPNDFGAMGGEPSHPELLDWLAVTFRDDYQGSLKKLHRLIVTSQAYRQSCDNRPAYGQVDAQNRLLWRMNRMRLDAEQVRDGILAVSGKLDLTMGGPSVRHFLESKGVHETPNIEYDKFDVDAPGSYRRSVYRFIFRTVPDPFMAALDCPDASQLTPKREVSGTALGALAMMNDRFVIRQSQHIAERLAKAEDEPAKQIQMLYQLALGRDATADEIREMAGYAAKHGMANACRMMLNSNEFMFVD